MVHLVVHRVKQLLRVTAVDAEHLAAQTAQQSVPAFASRAVLDAQIIVKMTAWRPAQEDVKRDVTLLVVALAQADATLLATLLAQEVVVALAVAYAETRVTTTAGVIARVLARMDAKALAPAHATADVTDATISAQRVARSPAVDAMDVMDVGFPAGHGVQAAALGAVKAFAPGVAILCARMDARETVVRVAIQTVVKVVQEPATGRS